ncbi:putative quinol monooxygenase [Cellvibrio zantedeschiae]|nr:antibiotic biosynthesis monooxygenase family protein [Cellvibrio zantedeschiae]
MSINVLVTFETKPEATQSFAALLKNISQDLLTVDGCQQAHAKVCADNPQRFMILESWVSKAAHITHIDKVVASGDWENIARHLSAAPVSNYYQDL